MRTTFDNALTKKYLIVALAAIASVNLVSNFLGEDVATYVGNFAYVPIAGSFLVLSLLIIARFGMTGNHGLAWVSFGGFAISWFIAEMLWIVQEMYLQIDPFPSAADIFYIVGYPFLLMFFIAYLQPVKSAITKKMLAVSIAISGTVLVTGLYIILVSGENDDIFEVVLGTIYPVFDAIVIVPALVGVSLFFKGHVNFMWTLLCFGIISIFIADTAFLIGQNEESYYTGNPMEILFYWNYILMSFGIYNQLTLFQKSKGSKLEDLR